MVPQATSLNINPKLGSCDVAIVEQSRRVLGQGAQIRWEEHHLEIKLFRTTSGLNT